MEAQLQASLEALEAQQASLGKASSAKSKKVMVRLRVPQQTKQQADEILRLLGLTTTQVVNILLAQIVARKEIPFTIGLPKDSDVTVPIEHVAKIWSSLDDTDYSYLNDSASTEVATR
jgi:addiction module RelB/DinJ family antitoxin